MSSNGASSSHVRRKRNRTDQPPQPPRDVAAFLSARALEALRKITNDPTAFPEFMEKRGDHRDAADIAIFAHNASLDTGPLENDQFHPAFLEFRKNTKDVNERSRLTLRLKRAVQDHAALLDQVTGSTTLVVSIPGAAEPNTPASPEYIKAYTYFPGTILRDIEADGDFELLNDIVQRIIREIGVPTVKRFERALKKTWSHLATTRTLSSTKARPLPEIRGTPQPIPDNSCRYLFYGRSMPIGTSSAMRDIERHMRRQSIADGDEMVDIHSSKQSVWNENNGGGDSTIETGTWASGGENEFNGNSRSPREIYSV